MHLLQKDPHYLECLSFVLHELDSLKVTDNSVYAFPAVLNSLQMCWKVEDWSSIYDSLSFYFDLEEAGCLWEESAC